MNQSYLNGPIHELSKRFRFRFWIKELTIKPFSRDYLFLLEVIQRGFILPVLGGIHLLLSIPDGPVFIVKLWFIFIDVIFGKLYSFNQNPICRNPNHSSVLSKKQNLGWFLQYSLHNIEDPPLKTVKSFILEGVRKGLSLGQK